MIGDRGWSPGKHQWLEELPEIDSGDGIPADDLGTILRVLRRAPGALRLDARWTKGVSGRPGPALLKLEEKIGYAFPILAGLRNRRAVRAIASALLTNLDSGKTSVGLGAKCMVALVYAEMVSNEMLRAEAVLLADLLAPGLDPRMLAEVGRYGATGREAIDVPEGLSTTEAAAVQLARAASSSPVAVNEITISTAVAGLEPEQVVEVVMWLAVLQMLHRLYVYYDAKLGLT